jgi:hypothetical protein
MLFDFEEFQPQIYNDIVRRFEQGMSHSTHAKDKLSPATVYTIKRTATKGSSLSIVHKLDRAASIDG